MKKHFRHDCDNCEFLGEGMYVTDVYLCPDGTLVARYGNKPDEYMSSNINTLAHTALIDSNNMLSRILANLISNGKVKIGIKPKEKMRE